MEQTGLPVRLEGYEKLVKKAEGGMADLYRGVQKSLNRPVAIKFLKTDIAKDERVRSLFESESQIIARLDHPNIIRVIDRGVASNGQPYFVMDYVEGTDLKEALRSGDMSYPRKLRLIIQVAKALAYAHRNGIVHRDIKPGNILLDLEGRARVADFGVAFFVDSTDVDILEKGTAVGTPHYMAPEQKEGAEFATAVSDIYSLGIMMYVLFVGVIPSEGAPLVHIINKDISEDLSKLVWQCILDDPKKRPQTADEVVSRVLSVVKGAHLNPQQKEKAKRFTLPAHEKFILLDVLKEDDFSSVYLYENREDNGLLILKKADSDASGYQENKLLALLKHKHIVNVVGVTRNERIFIAIMEYVNGGNLSSRLARPMTLEHFLPIAVAMSGGLSFAHKNRVVHGNLRPPNILFTDKGTVKIADFGFKEHYVGRHKKNWYCLSGEPISVKSDIYAVGVMFYQMLVGSVPKWTLKSLMPHKRFQALPESMQRLLTVMLMRRVATRIATFDDVLVALNNVKADMSTLSMVGITKAQVPPKRSVWVTALGGAAALIAMGGLAAAYVIATGGDLPEVLSGFLP